MDWLKVEITTDGEIVIRCSIVSGKWEARDRNEKVIATADSKRKLKKILKDKDGD